MEKSLHLQDHHQIRLNSLIACIHYIRHSLVWTPDPSGCVRKGLENNFVRNWLAGMPWFLNPANCSDLQSDSSGTTLFCFVFFKILIFYWNAGFHIPREVLRGRVWGPDYTFTTNVPSVAALLHNLGRVCITS